MAAAAALPLVLVAALVLPGGSSPVPSSTAAGPAGGLAGMQLAAAAGYPPANRPGSVAGFGTVHFHGPLAPEPAATSAAADRAARGHRMATAPIPVPAHPSRRGIGSFVVTCYDLRGTTASGAQVGAATVAVDPGVIPLGSRLYVDGAGYRVAQDTGGAIRGRRLDIWEPTYGQCAAWGVKSRQVWLVP